MKTKFYCVCIEGDTISGVFNYKPKVTKKSGIIVHEISEESFSLLQLGTHYFDIQTKEVVEIKDDSKTKQKYQNFLNDSDWLVLRHMREKFLELPTSLIDSEFRALEQKRQNISKLI